MEEKDFSEEVLSEREDECEYEYVYEDFEENKPEKNMLLLVSFILTGIYLAVNLIGLISTITNPEPDTHILVVGIMGLLLFPHYLLVTVAFIFNGIGVFRNKKNLALTGAILYTLSIAVMPFYFIFVLVQTILSYIGFSQMEK